jgi:hypothetical protein
MVSSNPHEASGREIHYPHTFFFYAQKVYMVFLIQQLSLEPSMVFLLVVQVPNYPIFSSQMIAYCFAEQTFRNVSSCWMS